MGREAAAATRRGGLQLPLVPTPTRPVRAAATQAHGPPGCMSWPGGGGKGRGREEWR